MSSKKTKYVWLLVYTRPNFSAKCIYVGLCNLT